MPIQATKTGVIIKTKNSVASQLKMLVNSDGDVAGVGAQVDGRLIPDLASLSVLPATKAADIGDIFQLFAWGVDAAGVSHDVSSMCNWTSSVPEDVSVDQVGMCKALAVTGSTITATLNLTQLGTLSDTCVVTVSAP